MAIVDGGTVRPLERCLPGSAASSRFSLLCLRKMYVLCSRGAEASSPQGCLLQVRSLDIHSCLREDSARGWPLSVDSFGMCLTADTGLRYS